MSRHPTDIERELLFALPFAAGASGSGVVLCDPPEEAALPAPVFTSYRHSTVGLRLAVLRPDADARIVTRNTQPHAVALWRSPGKR